MKIMVRLASIAIVSTLGTNWACASDIDDLTDRLQGFLAATHLAEAHASFWAEDLIYTSSNGTRFGKAAIMAGFEETDRINQAPDTMYSAADVDVRVFGKTAVVTFKLVGEPNPVLGAEPPLGDVSKLFFYNTGVFRNRAGRWQVVTWQATKIPPADE